MESLSFEQYYDQFKHKIYNYLFYRSGRKKELAEDLTAEVFLKAFEKFGTFRKDLSFKSWIYTIAHHHLIDYFRQKKEALPLEKVENVVESENDPKGKIEQRVAAEQVAELLPFLSDEERGILLLKYQQELSTEEIAAITGRPEATLRVIIHRTLQKLRAKYALLFPLSSSS